jgi:hypothetical protein
MGQAATSVPRPCRIPVDPTDPHNLALELADQAAVEPDPDRRRLLEQTALRSWQDARRVAP